MKKIKSPFLRVIVMIFIAVFLSTVLVSLDIPTGIASVIVGGILYFSWTWLGGKWFF